MRLYIVNLKSPACKIRERDLEVKVCPKTVWAVAPDGRRYLLGSSAFQTLPAAARCQAARCQAALLQKVIDNTYFQRYDPFRVQRAKVVLQNLALH